MSERGERERRDNKILRKYKFAIDLTSQKVNFLFEFEGSGNSSATSAMADGSNSKLVFVQKVLFSFGPFDVILEKF